MAVEPARTGALTVEVRTVDDTLAGLADDVVRLLSRRISAPCRHGLPIPLPQVPMLSHRAQADADILLAEIESAHVGSATTLVALTHVDLGHPLFTFFFGRARVGGAALVSTARLDPRFHGAPEDRSILLRRVVAESLHELGHTASLPHCPDYGCVMRFTGDVEMLDIRGEHFCDACSELAPVGLRRRATPFGWFRRSRSRG